MSLFQLNPAMSGMVGASQSQKTKPAVDRYLKRQVLGEGTYGVVYKALDTLVISSVSKSVDVPTLNMLVYTIL